MIFMATEIPTMISAMEITTGDRIGKDGHGPVAAGNGRTPGLNTWDLRCERRQQRR